ncbi:MAG: hypothetical protein V4719_18600 [Planctomycetota bacterium]
MEWVTLETFWSIEEANLALGFLQTEGIPCLLEGVAVAGNFWHLSNATGGVKLKVPQETVARATELLIAIQHQHAANAANEDLPDVDDGQPEPESFSVANEDNLEPETLPPGQDYVYDGKPGVLARLRGQKNGWIFALITFPVLLCISSTVATICALGLRYILDTLS